MKKLAIMLLAAATMLNFSSCKKVAGEGPIETDTRSINNFSGISSNIDCNLYFTLAPEYKVEIEAQRNILNLIDTYKNGNDLILKFKNNVNIFNYADIRVNISAPSLERFYVSGSGNANVTGLFAANKFETRVSGSGSLRIDHLNLSDVFTAGVSGSGSIKVLTGNIAAENVFVSGSGCIDLSTVKAAMAIAKVSGSGKAKVNATQQLDATLSGSGNIYYYGDPVINLHISGSGRVLRL